MSFRTLVLWAAVFPAVSGILESAQPRLQPGPPAGSPELLKTLTVAGNAGWVDTGMDIEEGWELEFTADGQISLQKGNPEANCGPEGYDIRGIQQPLPEERLGCLIGKVVRILAVRKDEKTGEEIRDELVDTFAIGRGRSVVMSLTGRLFIGINENVVKDNDGQFTVLISSQDEIPGNINRTSSP